jgi:cytochrome c oxidase subunit II
MRAERLLLLACAGLLGDCEGVQTAFGGQGEHSAQFITLFGIFLAVATVFYLLVIGFLVAVLVRRRRTEGEPTDQTPPERSNYLLRLGLIGWAAAIVVGLAGLTVASFLFDRADAVSPNVKVLQIKVTAHQFWWDVVYVTDDPSLSVHTANELHLPVDAPVYIKLASNDVIHSLWIPNLAGKQDLMPGRDTDLRLLPRKTGLFRGRCAEFCGVQHTNMSLDVTVESQADFKRWYEAQMKPAQPPRTPLALAGYNYVTTRECRMCHNVTGTPASGTVAPDLTHFASRRSIAAGTLPMNRGNLYGWVADPQAQKPGTQMPTVGLEPKELHAIVAYLEGLK